MKNKTKLQSVGVFRRTGRASADVATGRRELSLFPYFLPLIEALSDSGS